MSYQSSARLPHISCFPPETLYEIVAPVVLAEIDNFIRCPKWDTLQPGTSHMALRRVGLPDTCALLRTTRQLANVTAKVLRDALCLPSEDSVCGFDSTKYQSLLVRAACVWTRRPPSGAQLRFGIDNNFADITEFQSPLLQAYTLAFGAFNEASLTLGIRVKGGYRRALNTAESFRRGAEEARQNIRPVVLQSLVVKAIEVVDDVLQFLLDYLRKAAVIDESTRPDQHPIKQIVNMIEILRLGATFEDRFRDEFPHLMCPDDIRRFEIDEEVLETIKAFDPSNGPTPVEVTQALRTLTNNLRASFRDRAETANDGAATNGEDGGGSEEGTEGETEDEDSGEGGDEVEVEDQGEEV